jgi:hypothetical protein
VRALAANRQAATMAQPSIAAYVHQAFDVHLHLFAEIAFDHALLVYDGANPVDLLFAQLAYAAVDADPGLFKNLVGARAPYAVDVCESYFGPLIGR